MQNVQLRQKRSFEAISIVWTLEGERTVSNRTIRQENGREIFPVGVMREKTTRVAAIHREAPKKTERCGFIASFFKKWHTATASSDRSAIAILCGLSANFESMRPKEKRGRRTEFGRLFLLNINFLLKRRFCATCIGVEKNVLKLFELHKKMGLPLGGAR